MKPNEFKAWFDGFTEAIDKAPTLKQWARIKERVAEIDGHPVTQTVYLDRYVRPYPPPYWWATINNLSASSSLSAGNNQQAASNGFATLSQNCVSNNFDSLSAMNALGKADAQLLAKA